MHPQFLLWCGLLFGYLLTVFWGMIKPSEKQIQAVIDSVTMSVSVLWKKMSQSVQRKHPLSSTVQHIYSLNDWFAGLKVWPISGEQLDNIVVQIAKGRSSPGCVGIFNIAITLDLTTRMLLFLVLHLRYWWKLIRDFSDLQGLQSPRTNIQ